MNRQEIFLAALLHDIGKFGQRADESYWKSETLSEISKNLAQAICPFREQGQFHTHLHVLWTHNFFQLPAVQKRIKALGMEVNPFNPGNGQILDNMVNLAIYHHKPNTDLQKLVQMADHWASGFDRTKSVNEKGNRKNFKEIGLLSVFSQVNRIDNPNDFFIKMQGLDLNESVIFPTDTENTNYKDLWDKFINHLDKIPVNTDNSEQAGKAFIETLIYLLKKFTWCIPASTFRGDLPSLSLYDHLRVTAAIADCLYAYADARGWEDTFEKGKNRLTFKEGNHLPILLVNVDLSGIQSFLYNISGTKAAKSLKGRSYYLQMLIDTIIDRLILDNDLTPAHVIYSSGGQGYVLMPNTDEVKQNINELHQTVIANLLKEHGQRLYVCMDYVPFAYDNELKVIFNKDGNVEVVKHLGVLWQKLSEKTSLQKNHRFHDLLTLQFDDFFKPKQVQAKAKVCAVTGVELENDQEVSLDIENDTFVSKAVDAQIKMGAILKDADFFLTYRNVDEKGIQKVKSLKPLDLIIHKYLFDQKDLTQDNGDFRKITSFDFCRVLWANHTDFNLISELKSNKASYGFTFYGGNKQAENDDGTAKTFEDLAGDGSLKRLGVLRMDVDNLGQLFKSGLPTNQRNLATYSTLSFMLDLFFSGYLNKIRDSDDFKDWVNILYSGGDDIFAVGRWDKIIEFAATVRKSFEIFVGGRKDITISAGIALIGAKYPIAKGADLAKDGEDRAKSYDKDNKTKNALDMLGMTISWEDYDEVKSYKNNFFDLRKGGIITASLLQKIMEFYELKRGNENRKSHDMSYIWNAAYYLQRYFKRDEQKLKSGDGKGVELINSLKVLLVEQGGSSSILDKLALAARWAEMELRTIK